MEGVESTAPLQPQAPQPPATTSESTPTPANTSNPPNSNSTILPHALHSPKVLTECPIAVVLIFQSFREVMKGAMKDFYPLVMESISLQPEPQRQAYKAASANNQIFTGVAAGIKNREMYTEVIKAQVKVSRSVSEVKTGRES